MIDHAKIQIAVRMILEAVGENPGREGLLETPMRVAKMYEEVFSGLHADPGAHLDKCFYTERHDEMVLVKDISLYSMCEHHLLPFFGKAHVAYIPHPKKISGLSKLARVVETLSRRPQLQERLTTQIADTIMHKLEAKGTLVVIEAEHLCMTIRGVRKPGSTTVTSAVRGIFRTNHITRTEALSLIKGVK